MSGEIHPSAEVMAAEWKAKPQDERTAKIEAFLATHERLTEFVVEVHEYAHRETDVALQGMVEDCRADIASYAAEP